MSEKAMFVVFIHGPAAAGKYTVGWKLSKKTGLPLFHNHLTVDLVKTLFDFGTKEFIKLRSAIWKESFATAAKANRSFIFTFHPEATVEVSLIQELGAIIEARGGEIYFVELQCSEETVLQRLDNEHRRQFDKLVDRDLYRRISDSGGFDFPALPAPLITIETDRTNPDEAADNIYLALRDKIGRE
jgi:hypothetical protein